MSERALRIRDPVHGYIAVTAIEQPLLDHPITQRLRWVAQSGLAQLVFPEVRTSRFAHSLGAMHLASRFLLGLVSNAESGVRRRLEDEFIRIVREADPDVMPDAPALAVLRRQGLLAASAVDPRAAQATVVVEQALRLAALFHDLGHLPFSHDFEYVVQGLVNDQAGDSERFGRLGRGKPPHEQIGYAMAPMLQRSVYASLTAGGLQSVVSPAFKLARGIMRADAPAGLGTGSASVRLLHDLVDGELDVDRTDYLLRDARSYGFDYVSFDLDHLTASLTVHEGDEGELSIAILPQGQAAAESFLIARSRMYQWGVFHHKVVQVGAAFRAVTRDLLDGAFSNSQHTLHAFATEIATLADADADDDEREAALAAFATHDDVWWLTRLREHAADSPWSRLVLRRGRGPMSLWKRVSAFPGGADELAAINARLPRRGDTVANAAWAGLTQELIEVDDVTMVRNTFKPVKLDERTGASALCVGTDARDSRPLSELSPLVDGLPLAWARDLQVFAFTSEPVSDSADLAGKVLDKMKAQLP